MEKIDSIQTDSSSFRQRSYSLRGADTLYSISLHSQQKAFQQAESTHLVWKKYIACKPTWSLLLRLKGKDVVCQK